MKRFIQQFLILSLCVSPFVYADLTEQQIGLIGGWENEITQLRTQKDPAATVRIGMLQKRIEDTITDDRKASRHSRVAAAEEKQKQHGAASALQRRFRAKRTARVDAAVEAGEMRRDPLTLLVKEHKDDASWELNGVDDEFSQEMVKQIKEMELGTADEAIHIGLPKGPLQWSPYAKFFWDVLGHPLTEPRHLVPAHQLSKEGKALSDKEAVTHIYRAFCILYRRYFEASYDNEVSKGLPGILGASGEAGEWAEIYEAWKTGERTNHDKYGEYTEKSVEWKVRAHRRAGERFKEQLRGLWNVYMVACASIEWLRVSDKMIGFPVGQPHGDDAFNEEEMTSVRIGILLRLVNQMFPGGLGGMFTKPRDKNGELSLDGRIIATEVATTVAQLQEAKQVEADIPTGANAAYFHRSVRLFGKSRASSNDEQDTRRSYEMRLLMLSLDCYRLNRTTGMIEAVEQQGKGRIAAEFTREKAGDLYDRVVALRSLQNQQRWSGRSDAGEEGVLYRSWVGMLQRTGELLLSIPRVQELLSGHDSPRLTDTVTRPKLYRELLRMLLPGGVKTAVSFKEPVAYASALHARFDDLDKKQVEGTVPQESGVRKEVVHERRIAAIQELWRGRLQTHYRDAYILFLFFVWHALAHGAQEVKAEVGEAALSTPVFDSRGKDEAGAKPVASVEGDTASTSGDLLYEASSKREQAPRLAPGSVARPSSRLDEAESRMTKLIQEVRTGGERVYGRLQRTMKEFGDSFTQTSRIIDDLREGKTQSAVSGLVSVIELAQSEVGRLNGLIDETGNVASKTYEHLIKLLKAQREQKELIQSRLRELVEIKQKQVNELLTTAKRGLTDFGNLLERQGLVRWGSNWAFKKLMAKADAVTPEQIKERERQAARVTQLLADIERFSKGSITDEERASVKVEAIA